MTLASTLPLSQAHTGATGAGILAVDERDAGSLERADDSGYVVCQTFYSPLTRFHPPQRWRRDVSRGGEFHLADAKKSPRSSKLLPCDVIKIAQNYENRLTRPLLMVLVIVLSDFNQQEDTPNDHSCTDKPRRQKLAAALFAWQTTHTSLPRRRFSFLSRRERGFRRPRCNRDGPLSVSDGKGNLLHSTNNR
ncbi:hypothetical protein [Rhizobium anhuiense]|uniref:hypothetical protein n=1 Tax=Rhizobium anhuiense TaxID=1184720 RepID=UPI001440FA21